jgi:hypothetical protein
MNRPCEQTRDGNNLRLKLAIILDPRPPRVDKNLIRHRRNERIGWIVLRWGSVMASPSDHHSDFELGQLALLGVATIVLLVFVRTELL